MGRKAIGATSTKAVRQRASTRFSPADDFDAALAAAAGRHVGETLDRRRRQMKLDELVVRAIRAANAVEHDLSVAEFAKTITAMLTDLVSNGIVDGVLPSDTRLAAIVAGHIKTKPVAEDGDPIRSERPD